MRAAGINGARDTMDHDGQGNIEMALSPLRGKECAETSASTALESLAPAHSTSQTGAKVERETGFEPATSTLARSRSTK